MRTPHLLLLLTACLGLAAAKPEPVYTPTPAARWLNVPRLSPGEPATLLQVTRAPAVFLGTAAHPRIAVDGAVIVDVRAGEILEVPLPPGRHVLTVQYDDYNEHLLGLYLEPIVAGSLPYSLPMAAGQTYRFELVADFSGRWSLREAGGLPPPAVRRAGYGFTYAETATRAELRYGAEDLADDRQSLNLACDRGSGRIEVADRVVKKDGVVRVVSADGDLVLSYVSLIDGGLQPGEAYTPVSAPAFAALRATGQLRVRGPQEFVVVADKAGRAKIERFFRACETGRKPA